MTVLIRAPRSLRLSRRPGAPFGLSPTMFVCTAILLVLFQCFHPITEASTPAATTRPNEANRNTSWVIEHCTEKDALEHLKTLPPSVEPKDLEAAITNGWFLLSRELLQRAIDSDATVDNAVRSSVARLNRNGDEIIRMLDSRHKEMLVVSPAFQYAQSMDSVFLNVKFGYRWGSPGALSVEKENVTVTDRRFYFSGIGDHSHVKKKYELIIDLFDQVDPKATEWSFGSVGKLTVTLKKRTPNVWKRLQKEDKKISNMHVWWEMKDR
eukprot:GHVU01130851.1.p1 GENE.GHVU01130851.1~~GHVU01130851.1.p1  ORF type:complete len:267 (+),score=42.80 GHVU01130851.1:161-961(+)